MVKNHEINCDLLVIGAGMAGMAASLFAVNRNIDTLQVGITSEIIFASGLLDLLGVHPIADGRSRKNPWKGIKDLCHDNPKHPYAKMAPSMINDALEELVDFLNTNGLKYVRHENRNASMMTPVGTAKTTYFVPQTMWNGVQALETKAPCLVLGIKGLKGFSSRQMVAPFKSSWPGLAHATISFPGVEDSGEVYLEPLARSLALPKNRRALADEIRSKSKGFRFVGIPAVFGMQAPDHIQADLEKQVGVRLFEIPTMPPSIPGLRLKEAFASALPKRGGRCLYQKKVLGVQKEGRAFVVKIGDDLSENIVRARGVVLASGRFLGKGLFADRKLIRESIFNLPVYQPERRSEWHCYEFLAPAGHPINSAGLETDDQFRPLEVSGKAAYEMLFAAGSILAHQDWMRTKCGSGLAVATAFAAVNAFLSVA